MLSALLELLPEISTNQSSCNTNLDFISLLVAAYPDLQPWYVKRVASGGADDYFYMRYLSALLHHEDGSDTAKLDEELVKVILTPFY